MQEGCAVLRCCAALLRNVSGMMRNRGERTAPEMGRLKEWTERSLCEESGSDSPDTEARGGADLPVRPRDSP